MNFLIFFHENKLGSKIAQVIEGDVDEAIRWLKSDTTKEFKRLTAILALNELLKETPYITFNRIFGNSGSLQLIFSIIRLRSYIFYEIFF